MRKFYSVAGAALLLGCVDDASKSTAPQLNGAVVGASMDRGDNQGGRTVDVARLTGDEEVPARVTDASGRLSVKLSSDGQSVDYVLDVSDISNVTQAHIHIGARGGTGGVVVWLFPNSKSTAALPGGGGPLRRLSIEGTFTAADLRGTLLGQPLSALIAAIEAGNAYGNVHTDDGVAPANTGAGDFPGGELRGQLDGHGH